MRRHLEAIGIAPKGKRILGKHGITPLSGEEWEYFEECQPIVFATAAIVAERPVDPKAGLASAPFPCFSVEVAGDVFIGRFEMDHGPALRLVYLLCKELAPMDFRFLALGTHDYNNYELIELPKHMGASMASWYVDRIKYEAVGVENVRTSVKIGTGKSKRTHRIRRIVHVLPKKIVKKEKSGELRHIDFSHRFNVRGHWRKINGILGKDRNGDYTVCGYTWVMDHEKGPKHMPLVKKARLVDKNL